MHRLGDPKLIASSEYGEGLGLAIVQDVLNAYSWRLALATSELGGLKANIAPAPASD